MGVEMQRPEDEHLGVHAKVSHGRGVTSALTHLVVPPVKDLAGHLSGLLLQDQCPNNWLPKLPTGHTLTKKSNVWCKC